jgi:hypothetical protein
VGYLSPVKKLARVPLFGGAGFVYLAVPVAAGRLASHATTALSGHATARIPMRIGRGNSPLFIMAYSPERLRPVADSTAGRRKCCSVIIFPTSCYWTVQDLSTVFHRSKRWAGGH